MALSIFSFSVISENIIYILTKFLQICLESCALTPNKKMMCVIVDLFQHLTQPTK